MIKEKTPETIEETKKARLVTLKADIGKLKRQIAALGEKLKRLGDARIERKVEEEQSRYNLSGYRAKRLHDALFMAEKSEKGIIELKERAVASNPNFEVEYLDLLQRGSEALAEAWEIIRVGRGIKRQR